MLEWTTDGTFRVDDTEYVCHVFGGVASSADRFCICKTREQVEDYDEFLAELAPRRIFELGIHEGGSTAFFAQRARPLRLVAVDLNPPKGTALADFITQRELHDVVRPYYGVDQGDRAQLRSIVAAEFGDDALDLVVDDASHRFDKTRVSFDELFPRLRPGGLYVIEDWATTFLLPDQQPLTVLLLDAVMAAVEHPAVAEVAVDATTVRIRRGDAPLDPTSFSLRALSGEQGKRLRENL